jgi:hypothetical protein
MQVKKQKNLLSRVQHCIRHNGTPIKSTINSFGFFAEDILDDTVSRLIELGKRSTEKPGLLVAHEL